MAATPSFEGSADATTGRATSPAPPSPAGPAGDPGAGSADPPALRPVEGVSPGRVLACRRLTDSAKQFPDLIPGLVEPGPDLEAGMDPRDAALAHAIHDAAVRRWLTLSHLISVASRKPFDPLAPRLRAVLLAGAAQLLLLDRVPDHAAVNESVQWAKARIGPAAAAMVNATLRRLIGLRGPRRVRRDAWTRRADELPMPEGDALALAEPALPDDPAALVAVATSTPAALLERWTVRSGAAEACRLALHGLVRPPTILNVRHAIAPASSRADACRAHDEPGHEVFGGSRDRLIEILAADAGVFVQDPGSATAVGAIPPIAPRLVIDLCAGRGTKSRQLRARFPGAELIVSDANPERLTDLDRLLGGVAGVRIAAPRELPGLAAGRADLVLIDVPCSNTAVLARRPEARYRATDATIGRLCLVQRAIVESAAPLLAPGGLAVYSTCSLEPSENRRQATAAAHRCGWTLSADRSHAPTGLPGEPASGYRDGSFWAHLRRG